MTNSFSQHSFGQPEIKNPVDIVPVENTTKTKVQKESKQHIKIGMNTSLQLSISNSSNPSSQRDLLDWSQKLIDHRNMNNHFKNNNTFIRRDSTQEKDTKHSKQNNLGLFMLVTKIDEKKVIENKTKVRNYASDKLNERPTIP